MDTLTLALTLALVLALHAMLATLVAMTRRDAALTIWALGLGGSALGFLVLFSQGPSPSPWTLVLGNLLVVSFNISLPLGLRRFFSGKTEWLGQTTVVLVVWGILLLTTSVIVPSYPWRVSITALVMAGLGLDFVVVLWRRGRHVPLRLRFLLLGASVVHTVFQLIRAVLVHFSHAHHILEDQALSSLTFLASIAVVILWSGGLLLLDSHRLRTAVQADAAELKRLNRLKDRVLAMTGHDLRGPIGNLRLIWGDLGRQAQQGGQVTLDPEMVALVDRSLAGTQDLLENLFAFAEAQRHGAAQSGTSHLAFLASSVTDLWVPVAQSKGVQLSVEGEECPLAPAHPDLVSAVLRNLVGNAVKFTPSGGQVCVRTGATDGRPWFEVQDDGVGMNVSVLEQAEGLAEKVSRPGTDGERGSGFGLVLVRELVDAWGGTLEWHSAPGQGTRVRVGFPAAA